MKKPCRFVEIRTKKLKDGGLRLYHHTTTAMYRLYSQLNIGQF